MKVYWSRCGHGHGNFGDRITPLLLKRHGIPVEWAPPEHAELIGVGSILEKAPAGFAGIVWSSGFMFAQSARALPRARILALRGHLTRERVTVGRDQAAQSEHPSCVLGDAGLLCDDLTPPISKKHKLGIIPHFADADQPAIRSFANSSPDIRLIDICGETDDVLASLSACEYVASSSLHGLILADSLAIPNCWLEIPVQDGHDFRSNVIGEGFKFRDYYSIFGIEPTPLRLSNDTTLEKALEQCRGWKRPQLQEIQAALRNTLRAIKDSVAPACAEDAERRRAAQEEWHRKRGELQQAVASIVIPGSSAILADDDQLGLSFSGVRTIPFIEREGCYWGPPATAAEAVAEVSRHTQGGTEWLVIAWPMFWLFDRFPEFSRYVGGAFDPVLMSEVVIVLRLRKGTAHVPDQ